MKLVDDLKNAMLTFSAMEKVHREPISIHRCKRYAPIAAREACLDHTNFSYASENYTIIAINNPK